MHPTHRMVDGNRVEGLSRHALHRFNGRREPVNLTAYADGIVSVAMVLGRPGFSSDSPRRSTTT
ncbi:hypothetical protein OG216_11885 [Streptomycetaceae bacterium NBC_01309]